MTSTDIFNFNVGVLGHIDSGKTSLAKALSTTASTACFDKNPQSRERGITLDLGFSSFTVDVPDHLSDSPYKKMQVTLVDCPGHASLIRTIIGGSQIIDLMMLVVDVTKGIQTQTAECLVLGEITCNKLLIVLNKTDMLPKEGKEAAISKMSKKLQKTLQKTKFANAPIIPVSAKPGGTDGEPVNESEPVGVEELVSHLCSAAYLPKRNTAGPFIYAVDHCFSIRGQGTVMTGTVVCGKVAVNDTIEIPSLKTTRKVKSMQMFHRPVDSAAQGDRVGICVTQFDPKQLERGLVCTPNVLPNIFAAIMSFKTIPYYKGSITTKSKFHISIGHDTVMAKLHLFGLPLQPDREDEAKFDFSPEYIYVDEIGGANKSDKDEYTGCACTHFYALLEFEKAVTAPKDALVIGSRLDSDIHLNTCRLAFEGKLLYAMEEKNYAETVLPNLKIFKNKCKEGTVERMVNEYEIIVKGLFKKETNIQNFTNLKVILSTGERGTIESAFGQSGKIKIRIPEGLKETTAAALGSTKKKGKSSKSPSESSTSQLDIIKVSLRFKRYVYDTQKKIIQT